jgi:hypothetical protein
MRYVIAILIMMLLNTNFARGDDYGFYRQNENISCDIIPTNMNAVYELGRYTCENGYYLPADSETCSACPSGGYCSGGTFSLNTNEYQGLELVNIQTTINNVCADNFPSNMYATFTINKYTCATGYYLPADGVECIICPENSYCGGGTYTFNETVTQGIESCPNNWYSPSGMSSVAQCGRILHLGDDVVYLRNVKKTTPSLTIKVGDDIFYGNMTTNNVVMHNGATHRLKIRFNDTTYSVYDDTVEP